MLRRTNIPHPRGMENVGRWKWTLDKNTWECPVGLLRKISSPVTGGGNAVGGPDISSAPRGLDECEKCGEPSEINGFLPLDRETKFLSWRAVKSGVKMDGMGG